MMATTANTNMVEDNELKFDKVGADSPHQHKFLMLTDCVWLSSKTVALTSLFFTVIQYHCYIWNLD